MGCASCGGGNNIGTGHIKSVCRVCELLDNDSGFKFCNYCELCKAYICSSCESNWGRRALAFGTELLLAKRSIKPTDNLNEKGF